MSYLNQLRLEATHQSEWNRNLDFNTKTKTLQSTTKEVVPNLQQVVEEQKKIAAQFDDYGLSNKNKNQNRAKTTVFQTNSKL